MLCRWLYGAMAGIGVSACVVVGIVFLLRTSSSAPQETPVSSEALREAWERGAKDVIHQYGQTGDPVEARDQLLRLRVPSTERESHLALVLALEAFIQKRSDAEARWQRATEAFSAL